MMSSLPVCRSDHPSQQEAGFIPVHRSPQPGPSHVNAVASIVILLLLTSSQTDTGEECDYCGAAATRGPRWDSVLHATIDFTALPYCNWNVTTSTPRANFRNHVPLPLDHRPQRDWLNVGLFRDPRRRLVSALC